MEVIPRIVELFLAVGRLVYIEKGRPIYTQTKLR